MKLAVEMELQAAAAAVMLTDLILLDHMEPFKIHEQACRFALGRCLHSWGFDRTVTVSPKNTPASVSRRYLSHDGNSTTGVLLPVMLPSRLSSMRPWLNI
jgi:hypothetical protein